MVVVGGHTVDDPELKYGMAVTGDHRSAAHRPQRRRAAGRPSRPHQAARDRNPLHRAQARGPRRGRLRRGRRVDGDAQPRRDAKRCCAATSTPRPTSPASAFSGMDTKWRGAAASRWKSMRSTSPCSRSLNATSSPGTSPAAANGIGRIWTTKWSVAASVSATLREAAYDPQTSGGLLIAVAAKDAERLLDDLAASSVSRCPRDRSCAAQGHALGRARLSGPTFEAEEIAAALGPAGRIARGLPHYEHRREQIRMAERVAETFARGGVLAVEAGTGTGKSLAYLVPAIHWSRYTGERVIVSTQTINLQEQLVGVDLPLLAAHLDVPFRAALVKGRGNYVCLRKAAEVRASPVLVLDDAIASRNPARSSSGRTRRADGTLADLPFVPRPDAWDAVAAEHDDCLRARCPEYERCFFYKARKEAAGRSCWSSTITCCSAISSCARCSATTRRAACCPPRRGSS